MKSLKEEHLSDILDDLIWNWKMFMFIFPRQIFSELIRPANSHYCM